MAPISLYAQIALVLLGVLAAAWDVRTRTIPNWLTLAAAAVGLCLAPLDGLKGLALGLALQLPFFLWRKIGGGDVKLMAAAGALAGWKNLIILFLATSILQALVALVVITIRKKKDGVPRGPSFLAAVLVLLVMIWANT